MVKWKDEVNVIGILRTVDVSCITDCIVETKLESFNRMLYTPKGNRDIIRVASWRLGDDIILHHDPYPEQMKNFYGTKMEATTLDFRPFSDFKRIPGEH